MRATTRLLAELIGPEGRLDPDAWADAHRDRTPVGVCGCGGLVYTDHHEPEFVVHFGVRWYAMRCQVCDHTSELPGTRQLPRGPHRPSRALAAVAADIERRRLGEDE